MLSDNMKSTTIALTAILFLLFSGFVSAQGEVIDIEFGQPPASDSDTSRTLESLVKVQGTGGLYQDGLYLITHFGDREEMFRRLNQDAIDNPWRDDTWRYCSVFSVAAENSVIMGRNWDNQNVGSIIISLYQPPNGYSAISFCRAIDLGYPLNLDLEQIKLSPLAHNLLLAPFYATDGINEYGLAVALAGVREVTHESVGDQERVFVTYLVRKILDQTKTVEEAVNLAEQHVPFDLDENSLNGHLIVADSSGRSVILEYDDDQWRIIYGDKSWQVLTTRPIYNVPDAELREKCWRYRSMSETLEKTKGDVDWQAGMDILQDVTQKGTTWSVVYALSTRELYATVYQKWDTVYHLRMP